MPNESEPPVREFADRGTLWLLESPENLRGLVRLAVTRTRSCAGRNGSSLQSFRWCSTLASGGDPAGLGWPR
jgi:hypothetical protein